MLLCVCVCVCVDAAVESRVQFTVLVLSLLYDLKQTTMFY